MRITVFEYEKLLIKQHRNEQLHYITAMDAAQLQNIFVGDVPAFVRRDNYVAAQQWVGVVDLQGLSIEVLPKISFCESSLQNRKNLNKYALHCRSHHFVITERIICIDRIFWIPRFDDLQLYCSVRAVCQIIIDF